MRVFLVNEKNKTTHHRKVKLEGRSAELGSLKIEVMSFSGHPFSRHEVTKFR